MMQIESRKDQGVALMALKGRLDVLTSKELDAALNKVLDEGERYIVLDFTALDYVSSSGLRVLLAARKRLKTSNGQVALCGLNAFNRDVMETTGFISLFALFSNAGEAIDALKVTS